MAVDSKLEDKRRRVREAFDLLEYVIRNECEDNGHRAVSIETLHDAKMHAEMAIDDT